MVKIALYWLYTVLTIVYTSFYIMTVDSLIEDWKDFLICTIILIVLLVIGIILYKNCGSFIDWLEDYKKIQE
jgi:Na+/proline symporter